VDGVPVTDLRLASAHVGADAYVVAVAGDFDLYGADTVDDELAELDARGARRLVFDLLGTTFLDSYALGVLVRTARRLRGNGGEVVLVCDDPRVLRTFEITGLAPMFRFESSLTAAIHELTEAGDGR
jgi:anti-sigma B factor antagonist